MKLNINDLIKKAEDEKTIEFFLEILTFLKEVKPVFELMNHTIADGTSKIPNASKKLSKVTEATEIATTEIMNILDQVFANVNKLKESSNDKATLDVIDNDLSNIMMALQVQDITSQQIAAVNHMLSILHQKLIHLLAHFDADYIKQILSIDLNEFYPSDNISKMHRDIAFDPEAIDSITSNINRQDKIDELLAKASRGEDLSNIEIYEKTESVSDSLNLNVVTNFAITSNEQEISADDINALFGNQSDSENVSADDIDALFGGGSASDEVSADDINALFGGGSASDEVSADDIDALFNSK